MYCYRFTYTITRIPIGLHTPQTTYAIPIRHLDLHRVWERWGRDAASLPIRQCGGAIQILPRNSLHQARERTRIHACLRQHAFFTYASRSMQVHNMSPATGSTQTELVAGNR